VSSFLLKEGSEQHQQAAAAQLLYVGSSRARLYGNGLLHHLPTPACTTRLVDPERERERSEWSYPKGIG